MGDGLHRQAMEQPLVVITGHDACSMQDSAFWPSHREQKDLCSKHCTPCSSCFGSREEYDGKKCS